MLIGPLRREELVGPALNYAGVSPIYLSGPHKGRPVGERRMRRIVEQFIRSMKSDGRMIERRPIADPTSTKGDRVSHFIFVPKQLQLF